MRTSATYSPGSTPLRSSVTAFRGPLESRRLPSQISTAATGKSAPMKTYAPVVQAPSGSSTRQLAGVGSWNAAYEK